MSNNAHRLHAHISEDSSDCDGGHGNYYVESLNADELHEVANSWNRYFDDPSRGIFNDFSEYQFQRRILGMISKTYCEGVVNVSESSMTYSRQTDEGYESVNAYWCYDDCDETEHSVYDQFAELAGY